MEDVKQEVESLISTFKQKDKAVVFDAYQHIYPFATENVQESLSSYDKNNSILTVMASSDQFFNYLLKGARNIDTFDINKVTKYYFELKKAMILFLSYSEYTNYVKRELKAKDFFCALEYLEQLKPYMEENAYFFWYYYKQMVAKKYWYLVKQTNDFEYADYQSFNLYLESPSLYQKLQSILNEKITYHFFHTEIFSLPMHLEKEVPYKKYHEIYLSNIFQYIFPVSESVNEIGEKLSSHLEDDGRIVFYGYDVYDHDFSKAKVEKKKLKSGDFNYYWKK